MDITITKRQMKEIGNNNILSKFLMKEFTSQDRSWSYSKEKSKVVPILILSFFMSWLIVSAFNSTQIPETKEITQEVNIEKVSEEALSDSLPVAGAISEISKNLESVQKIETEQVNITVEPIIEEPEKIEYNLSDFSFDSVGYATTKLRIREEPNTDSEIIGMLYYNDEISYDASGTDGWVVINYNDEVAFVSSEYISDEKAECNSMSASGDTRKSFMDYTTITKTSSPQYKLQQQAYTASNGVRVVNGRYCIALGSYYSHNVGQYVDLVLANGTIIPCIIGDCKADCDTYNNHSIGVDGGVSEFIVQTSALNSTAQGWGDCSYCEDSWNSNVIEIRLYDVDLL